MAGKIKWVLGASIVLNVFLLAAMGGSAYVVKQHCKSKAPAPMASTWDKATKDMPPEAKARIKGLMKQSALSGEEDMAKARDLRAEAARLAATNPYEPARIAALSEEARSYEDQARAKVERALIEGMAALSADERRLVADHLLKASFRFRYFLMKPTDAKPGEANASASK
ncbi:integral membrane protein [Asticcacaulis biprosthecium C19]|uniref:Integral membrane protein n=1 Tax=Asticcacaulis biprosthecium C19 TaxID=715226 RepID=F4QPM9_9CAUL|nr:periplasmic heavy metal sensor [Asticcacaulis biprosthecium]EGF91287.1 integral membrane protein [Asticcacaulis biprosthecium C19]